MKKVQFIKIVKPQRVASIICRICLTMEGKFYRFFEFQLQTYYEELLGTKIPEIDQLPQYICMECATHLQKFHKFREKCVTSYNHLSNLVLKGGISIYTVSRIDRKAENLNSPINIMKLTDRVGVFFAHESEPGTISKVDYNSSDDAVIKTEIPMETENIEVGLEVEVNPEQYSTEILPKSEVTPKFQIESEPVILPMHETEPDEIEFESMVKSEEDMANQDNGEDSEYQPRVIQYRIVRNRRTRHLDPNNWVKTTLTEEEALAEFNMKCLDPTYMKSPYKCDSCYRGFSKEEMYNRHITLRHSESLGDYKCKLCQMRFKWQSHVRIHMKKHYNKYHCQRCPFVCSLEHTALAHEEYHSGAIKKCMHCSEEFRHISTYYTHIRNVHRSEYICVYCGASFVSEAGLHQHKKVKHFDIEMYPPAESENEDEDLSTYCERCDIAFHSRKAYDEHKFHSVMHTEGAKDHKDEDMNIPRKGMNIPRKGLGRRLRVKVNEPKTETKDGTSPETPAGKRMRRDKRPKAIPTTCYQCGEHFDTQTACMRHHLAAHPGTSFYPPNQRYICEICGASLAPGSVAVHHNLHTREKKYPCPTCGKVFHSTVGVKRHLITHTGEKRYGCTLCDKRFTQSNSMKLHYRTFHLKQPYPKRNRVKKKALLGRLHPTVMVEVEPCDEEEVDQLEEDQEEEEVDSEELESEVIDMPMEEHNVAVQYLSTFD